MTPYRTIQPLIDSLSYADAAHAAALWYTQHIAPVDHAAATTVAYQTLHAIDSGPFHPCTCDVVSALLLDDTLATL